MSKADLLQEICGLAGNTVSIVEMGRGWPGIVDVLLPSGKRTRVALHVSTVSSHARKTYESRFQNPGTQRPVVGNVGLPILIGVERINNRAVLVAVDGKSRVDRLTRQSFLFNNIILEQALRSGWAMYQSKTERIYAFLPPFMPVYVELLQCGFDSDFSDSANRSIQVAVSASGFIDEPTTQASERARRTASVLIRDYAFGGSVVRAYRNLCSMCGINSGLVIGAHIFPVEAPKSPDCVWNGLALCQNHHAAFDQHKICVDPVSRKVRFRLDIHTQSKHQPALRAFVGSTFEQLMDPSETHNRPKDEMFVARHQFYDGQYDWATARR